MAMRPTVRVPIYPRVIQIEMDVHGLTVAGLARRAGFHRTSIDNALSEGECGFELACGIAKALDVDVDIVANLQEYQSRLGVRLW